MPLAFMWRNERLAVGLILKRWRTTKHDRGETYLHRHWFEFDTTQGRRAVVYFDRHARRGESRWWLYTLALPTII